MQRRTTRPAAILFALLTLSGAAAADGGRARTIGQLQAAADRYQAATRPDPVANASSTVQEGRGNAAGIAQTGSANTAGIRQFGRDNTGTIVQTGTGNAACLIQAGRNLGGSIEQTGDNQTTGLLQTRWGESEIPVEACTTATTRQEVMSYVTERGGKSLRVRRGRGRSEP